MKQINNAIADDRFRDHRERPCSHFPSRLELPHETLFNTRKLHDEHDEHDEHDSLLKTGKLRHFHI